MTARPKRLRMEWDGGERAEAPDGTVYVLPSEQIRGEPRFYMKPYRSTRDEERAADPRLNPFVKVDYPEPPNYQGRKEQARRWAELDAYVRCGDG